jgi:hypothetical protein
LQRNVPVYSIVFTASVAGIVELSDPTKLSYADTVVYTQDLTQIYPVLSGVGHLMRLIDPSKPAELALITPKTGQYYSYCRNSGCDYSLRLTFADASVQMIVVQKGFRGWFNDAIPATINDANSTNGFRTWAVNVSSAKAISKIELLETPEVWKGLPMNPKIIATREVK